MKARKYEGNGEVQRLLDSFNGAAPMKARK